MAHVTMRRLAAAATLAIAVGTTSACGAGHDFKTADSVEDFCNAMDLNKAAEEVGQPKDVSEKGQKDYFKKVIETWVANVNDTGVPEDMPDEAAQALEEGLGKVDDIDWNKSMEDLEKELDEIEVDDKGSDKLDEYMEKECPDVDW